MTQNTKPVNNILEFNMKKSKYFSNNLFLLYLIVQTCITCLNDTTNYIYDNIIDGNHKIVMLSKVYNVCHNFYNVKIKSIEIINDFNTKN